MLTAVELRLKMPTGLKLPVCLPGDKKDYNISDRKNMKISILNPSPDGTSIKTFQLESLHLVGFFASSLKWTIFGQSGWPEWVKVDGLNV